MFLYCKTISIKFCKKASSDKRKQTVGDGRSGLIPDNAKHLYAENKLRRIDFSHISNGKLAKTHKKKRCCETISAKILQKGLKCLEGTIQNK